MSEMLDVKPSTSYSNRTGSGYQQPFSRFGETVYTIELFSAGEQAASR